MRKFRLLNNRFEHTAGTIVYEYNGPSYGLSSDDEFYTQKPHTTVTLNENGGTPFFTVPEEDIVEIV